MEVPRVIDFDVDSNSEHHDSNIGKGDNQYDTIENPYIPNMKDIPFLDSQDGISGGHMESSFVSYHTPLQKINANFIGLGCLIRILSSPSKFNYEKCQFRYQGILLNSFNPSEEYQKIYLVLKIFYFYSSILGFTLLFLNSAISYMRGE